MLSTLLASWLWFMAGHAVELTAGNQLPEIYQVIHRVPIPDTAAMRSNLAEANGDLSKAESRLRTMRADVNNRRENREKIRELAAEVLEQKRFIRELESELRNAHVLLFCVDTIRGTELVIDCNTRRLTSDALTLNRSDFIQIRRNPRDHSEITAIARTSQPRGWRHIPLDLRFSQIVPAVDLWLDASLGSSRNSVIISVGCNPDPRFARFSLDPRKYELEINLSCEVWLVDMLGNLRDRILSNTPIHRGISFHRFQTNHSFDRDQISFEANILGGDVWYIIDWDEFHEDGR